MTTTPKVNAAPTGKPSSAPSEFTASVKVMRHVNEQEKTSTVIAEVRIIGPSGKSCQFDPAGIMFSPDGTRLLIDLKEVP